MSVNLHINRNEIKKKKQYITLHNYTISRDEEYEVKWPVLVARSGINVINTSHKLRAAM